MDNDFRAERLEQSAIDFLKANETIKFKDLSKYQQALLRKVGKQNCEFFSKTKGWQSPKTVDAYGKTAFDLELFYWKNIYRIKAEYRKD